MNNYVFNNTETGQVWTVQADNVDEAASKLPEDADWDDWFQV